MTVLILPTTARASAFPRVAAGPKPFQAPGVGDRVDHVRRASPIHGQEISVERAVSLIFRISDLPVQLIAKGPEGIVELSRTSVGGLGQRQRAQKGTNSEEDA